MEIWSNVRVWKILVCMAIQEKSSYAAQLHGLSKSVGPKAFVPSTENVVRCGALVCMHISVRVR